MTVHPAEHGLRLDKALLCWLPLWGLRARRRLCEQGLVLLEGKTCTPACKVRAGQQIHIAVALEKMTGILDAQGGTPLTQGGTPPTQGGTPLTQGGTPLAQGGTPLAQGDTPPTQGGTPLTQGGTPRVQGGTPLALAHTDPPAPHMFSHADAYSVLVTHSAHVAAVFKPAGLHTAHLAGSLAPSLEDDLEALLRDMLLRNMLAGDMLAGNMLAGNMLAEDLLVEGITDHPAFATPRLLNRLDQGTSGLVLVALTPEGQRAWRMAEARGAMDKRYVAVVAAKKPFHNSGNERAEHCGDEFSGPCNELAKLGNELAKLGNELLAPCTVRFSLDTCQRTITRVLATDSPDPLRHTRVIPLGRLPQSAVFFPETEELLAATDGKLQLVGCCIRKGARHQIRAHLAALGFPLAGDPVYGQPLSTPFYLHHGAVAFDDFAAHHIPHWFALLPADLRHAAQSFLQTASNTATG